MMTSLWLAPLGMVILGGIYLVAQRLSNRNGADAEAQVRCCGTCTSPCGAAGPSER